jgi:Stage II sporulation protein E (SpoIIE)
MLGPSLGVLREPNTGQITEPDVARNAAVIMGRMRSALRAYALDSDDPGEVLERLSRKMQHFEPDAMASVLCAMISPSLDQMSLSSAGHLPPLIAYPGEPWAGGSPARRSHRSS